MKRVLLLTDSRGVHKPAGSKHSIYSERLARLPGVELVSLPCPYQWTTLPDCLHLLERFSPEQFDHVILHAGIVDHSPRPLSQMLGRLYEPQQVTDADTVKELLRTRNFSKQKIVNAKKHILDDLFGEAAMRSHFSRPFDEMYEGENTLNLYSLDMMKAALLPRLQAIPNLTFISANSFCPGWNGDYPKARPDNIRMIEAYSQLLCAELPKVVDLHQWSTAEVKRYTCDNLHLSADGSEWVFLRVQEALGLRSRDYLANRRSVGPVARSEPWPLRTQVDKDSLASIRMDEPEVLSTEALSRLRDRVGRRGMPLATLIVGLRIQKDEPSRLENLRSLIAWLDRFYGDAFDVLIVEQDKESTSDLRELVPGKYRYEFLYNPEAYNRGWLYNVAVKHLTDAPVVGFLDTDILPASNFLQCIVDCYADFDAVSPNRCLYYSTEEQKAQFLRTGSYRDMPVTAEALKNPTSFAGGMLVVNRDRFLDIGGFEQYVGYGCEDRALDVTMLALLPAERVRMDSYAYFHQHHPSHSAEHVYFKDIYAHMVENYGCEYTRGLSPTSYIHANCSHDHADMVRANAQRRKPHIGDPLLYTNCSYVTINGLPGSCGGRVIPVGKLAPSFPPSFTGLNPYDEAEEFRGRFAASWAPAVPKDSQVDDTEQLAFFYNRFKGKRCFIIGNGPSLNLHDLSLLQNEYTFAVNSFYYKTRETGFKPTFFVVEDSSVIKENVDEIVAFDTPFKFFPTIYRSLHPKVPGTYFFKLNRGFYEKGSPNYAIPRFSTDITRSVFCGQSVTYVNLQLAFYMGFTEVFLIGMDFNYVIPPSHTRTGDVLLSDTDDINHFHKDYFGRGKTWKDPKLDRVLMNYKMARLVYECAGRRIYNATAGGKLEAFERVAYDGLFGGLDPSFAQPPLDLTRPPEPGSKAKAAPAKKSEPSVPAVLSRPMQPRPASAAKSIVEPRAVTPATLLPMPFAPSISSAQKLFASSQYEACAEMCEELFAERGLRMYQDFAEAARARLVT
jgi:Protein of unknown function DUF115